MAHCRACGSPLSADLLLPDFQFCSNLNCVLVGEKVAFTDARRKADWDKAMKVDRLNEPLADEFETD